MNKAIKIISYISTLLLCGYLVFASGILVVMVSLGMKLLVYHPLLPLTEEYSGDVTPFTILLIFSYIFLSSIYFGYIGWKHLKKD